MAIKINCSGGGLMGSMIEERDIKKYKAILFDVGDTLFKREPANHEIRFQAEKLFVLA